MTDQTPEQYVPEPVDAGKFWRLPGIHIERLPVTEGLRVWVDGRQVFITAERADHLSDWLDRSRS